MAKKYNYVKNGKQYFRKTKTVGYKLDGSPIKKEFYGDGEKDCDKQIEEYMNKLRDGLKVSKEYITVAQLMNEWLFEILLPSINVKSSSFEKHECNYRLYVKNAEIGYLKLISINSKHIQLYYNKLYKDNGASSKKIFDINKTLRKFFNYCVSEHYIKENPCSLTKIQIPGDADSIDNIEEDDDDEEVTPFLDDEVKKISKSIRYTPKEDNTFKIAVQLDLITGLRKGELLGLSKKNIDIDKCKIYVRKTLRLVKVFKNESNFYRELRTITPKNKSSIRTVYFPSKFKKIFKKYLEEQEKKYEKKRITIRF